MKICVISTPIFKLPPAGYAGLEQLAWQHAQGLAKKGHEVSLIGPDGSYCEGVQIIQTGPERSLGEKQAYQKYWKELKDFDVILDHSWEKWSYLLKEEGYITCPILGWMHAPVNTMYGSLPPVEKPSMVCISEDQKAHFEALHNRPAKVCYNGIDLDYYKPIPGIKRTDRFLFLARFSSIKGADLAIRACREAGVPLDLVGDTSITGEPDFLRACQELCDGNQIKIAGPASRSECVHWFTQARCLLHPVQRFREPFGLAPVESQAVGVPVIAWDNGAMRETVVHHRTGELVRSYEQLVNAIRTMTPSHSESMRLACRENAQRFTVKRMLDRVEQLCNEAVATGGW